MRWRLALCLIACTFPASAQLFNIASFDARPGETTFGNGGQPWPIGTINAENYDTAVKPGIAFNVPNSNTLPACQATTYRSDAANLQTSSDGPAFQIGCAVTGTWYQYIINIPTPSPCPCKVTPRLGSPSAGGSWAFYIDDTLIGAVATPNTGSYTTMQGVDSAPFNLASGNHTVRWQWASGDANGYAGSMSSFQFPGIGGGLLPADRDAIANWKMAGLLSIGGIPSRSSVCATLSPSGGDDAAPIQSAINSCAANGVVMLNAGTFNLNSACVNVNKNIVLRGAGAGQTILAVTNGSILGDFHSNGHNGCVVAVGGGGTISNTTNLTGDGVQGAFSVNVASTSGISIGSLVLVDELGIGQAMPDVAMNGGTGQVWASPDYRVEWNAHSPGTAVDSSCVYGTNNFSCGTNGDECAYSIRCGGVNEELHLVSAINGNTITFDSPLTLSYRTANTAQVHVYSPSTIVQQAGIENLTMWGGDQGNLTFGACVYCWNKNIESYQWLNQGGIYFGRAAFRDQADTCWVHNAAWPVNGGGGYAINLTFGASEEYITNCVSMLANKVIVMRASGAGSVVAYNYMDDGYINGNSGWVETGLNCSHLVGSHHALFEGNQSFNIDSDFTHGASPYCTYFRNYITGIRETFTGLDGVVRNDSAGCCGPQRALASHPYTYWTSFIGNIAGTPGVTTAGHGWVYSDNGTGNGNSGASSILKLGWNDFNLNTSQGGPSQPDNVANTIYPATPSGVTASGCLADADPCTTIVDGNYDYQTNSIHWASNDIAHTLPNSFYLTGTPSFFGSSTWPPVDPINATVYNIPAHARWEECQPSPTAACVLAPGFMTLTVTPASPSISSGAALGSTVATLSVTWSDGHPFSGTFGFAAPNFDDGGTFAISGSNVIVKPGGTGVARDGGTIQNITVTATE